VSNLAAFRTGWVTLSQDFREKGSSLGNIFAFYKARHILLSDSANCTVLRAVVFTLYRRVTDGQTDRQTDGIAVASTARAMRGLRRAVETVRPMLSDRCLSVLSCLSVCDVGVLWPNGFPNQDETRHAGRPRPWPHCVRWGLRSPSHKRAQPPPNFRLISVAAKWLNGSRCYLVGR